MAVATLCECSSHLRNPAEVASLPSSHFAAAKPFLCFSVTGIAQATVCQSFLPSAPVSARCRSTGLFDATGSPLTRIAAFRPPRRGRSLHHHMFLHRPCWMMKAAPKTSLKCPFPNSKSSASSSPSVFVSALRDMCLDDSRQDVSSLKLAFCQCVRLMDCATLDEVSDKLSELWSAGERNWTMMSAWLASVVVSFALMATITADCHAFVVAPSRKLQSDELATVQLFQDNTPSVVYITNLASRLLGAPQP